MSIQHCHLSTVPSLHPSTVPNLAPLTAEQKTIICIEGTHTSDSGAYEALTRLGRPVGKLHQHALNQPVDCGWTVHYYPVVITHSGLVLNTAAASLAACGVTPQAAGSAVRKVALNALQYDIKFRKARAHIQRENSAAGPHDPG